MIQRSRFKVQVLEVHSGDDLILMVDLGVDDLFKKVRARLFGVDTPDAYKADSTTEAGKIREDVRKTVVSRDCYVDVNKVNSSGWVVTLHVIKDGTDLNLNTHLADMGYIYKGRGLPNVKQAAAN